MSVSNQVDTFGTYIYNMFPTFICSTVLHFEQPQPTKDALILQGQMTLNRLVANTDAHAQKLAGRKRKPADMALGHIAEAAGFSPKVVLSVAW